MQSLELNTERRRFERSPIQRPAKIHHYGTNHYLPACTHDLSSGGILLEIDSPRPLSPGDCIDVLIGWNDRAFLHEDDRIPARITRVLRSSSPRQIVAAQFDQVIPMPSRAAAA